MKELATSILKDCTETYFLKIENFTGNELLEYNKSVMGIIAKPVGNQMQNAIEWNMEVKKGNLKFKIEPRKGYKLLTYYI